MYQIENKPDMASVLSGLTGVIQEFNVPMDHYLQHIGEREICNPFKNVAWTGSTRSSGSIPDDFWEILGIRRLILEQFNSQPVVPDRWYEGIDDTSKVYGRWKKIKNEAMVQGVSEIFGRCPIIEFTDWAGTEDTSCSWDGLYRDVIKPLKKRDFQFIFHLGDVTGKGVFEIDEVLDIIGDYSSYGKVALVLDDSEADSLWCKLNGRPPGSSVSLEPKERCLSLFNTMSIDVLQILHGCRAVRFSKDAQFDLVGRSQLGIPEAIDARSRFSAGYHIGSLLQLETMHCMALGLAVSEGYTEPSSGHTGSAQLLSYIHNWINILN